MIKIRHWSSGVLRFRVGPRMCRSLNQLTHPPDFALMQGVLPPEWRKGDRNTRDEDRVLVSQTLVTPIVSSRSLEEFGEKKTYYPLHHGGSHEKPACTPSTPSHGGSGHGTPTTPSHGGGGYYSPPSTPAVEPRTPTTPSHGGGGYGYPPPSGVTPPSTPVDPGTPTTPSHGGGGYYSPPTTPIEPGITPTPTTPLLPPTPYTPGTTPPSPYTPGISTPPSPLFPIDPNVPPFLTGTCNYWRTHPQVIWGLFGYWGTLGSLLGGAGTPAANLNILDALRNTRTDGVSALYREATASFLNSMVNRRFTFSTQQVRDAFTAALASEQTAANQARIFQRANEGRLRH
ncbi:hypothetical protein Taro_005922 [Colocasia esculenta]|uniref:Protodermal factor 1 n=1 Tax=Colocasia esculenta TaxID=4460 RepID=A0A843TR72_COLES|nr:hypothetical protein [Colocasia esculenta]